MCLDEVDPHVFAERGDKLVGDRVSERSTVRGTARVVSMPDASTICFTALPTVCLANFPGIARSNCLAGIHATIYPGFRYGNTTSAVSCCVEPWKHSCGLWMIQKRGLPGFPSAQRPKSSRPLQLLISRCLSVCQPIPMRSSLHPPSN